MDKHEFIKLLDERLQPLAKKSDLESISSKIDQTLRDYGSIKQDLEELRKDNEMLIKKLDSLENRSRRNNLNFWGINRKGVTDYIELVKNFCRNNLKIDGEICVNRAHPDGPYNNINVPIKAHIPYDSDINKILSNCFNLAGTNYSVQRDYSKKVRDKRTRLFAIRKELILKNAGTKIVVAMDRLIIDKQRFDITDDYRIMFNEECGAKKIYDNYNVDVKNILEKIEKKIKANIREREENKKKKN